YYTKHLIPLYIEVLSKARMKSSLLSWFLQEDNDSSHGTMSNWNVAFKAKIKNWICTISYPTHSSNFNLIEGLWDILLQRVKQQILYGNARLELGVVPEKEWDGTKQHLKKILQE
ncbi:hypothetical protein K469DRAFT_600089, partial [Zopfia rhizophila CBS 207.26]